MKKKLTVRELRNLLFGFNQELTVAEIRRVLFDMPDQEMPLTVAEISMMRKES